MKGLVIGLVLIVGLHVGLPYLVATAAMVHVNSGGGQAQDRISDVEEGEKRRLLDARRAIVMAAAWTKEDHLACLADQPMTIQQPDEVNWGHLGVLQVQSMSYARCLQEEAYTRIIYTLRRGCLGTLVETCFEDRP